MLLAHVNSACYLRRSPEIITPNIIRVLPAGDTVWRCEVGEYFDGVYQWVYVVGRDYWGWVSAEYLRR